MKTKLFKRVGSFVLACVMMSAFSVTSFAAEPTEDLSDNQIVVSTENDTSSVSVLAEDRAVSGSVEPWSSITMWPHLSNYIGFSKTLRITTVSSGDTGGILIELKKSGTLKSDGNWIMGINDAYGWKFTLPESGDYELIIHNHSDYTVHVNAQWV